MAEIVVAVNEPFLWSKGTRLRASNHIVIAIPAEVLVEGERLDSIIELSNDDARIAFQEAEKSGDGYSAILIELQPGERMRLNRSTEAVAMGSTEKTVVFEVED